MGQIALQDFMEDIGNRIETISPGRMPSNPPPPDTSRQQSDHEREIRAYLTLDPVLADLHKQYLNARATEHRIIQQLGPEEPMAQTAKDAAESWASALQTRLIELRQDATINFLAAQIVEQDKSRQKQNAGGARTTGQKPAAPQKARPPRYRRVMAVHQHRTQKMIRKAQKAGEDGLFTAFIMLWMVNMILRQVQHDLNLASSFKLASTAEQENRQCA